MIEGIETVYQQIADSIVEAIQEPWTTAKVEAIFFADSITFESEYTRKRGGVASFATLLRGDRAFRELRKKFKEAGQPVRGQACFVLHDNGKFNMTWGYENCDENGNTVFDEAEWARRQEERRKRLTSGGER
jgi:hypothetical protein